MPDELPRYICRGSELTVKEGEDVFHRGQQVDDGAIYYLFEGEIELIRSLGDGRDLYQIELGPGDIFGMVSSYGSERYVFSARALETSRLYRWNRQNFDQILGIYQEMATKVIQDLSRQLRQVNEMRR